MGPSTVDDAPLASGSGPLASELRLELAYPRLGRGSACVGKAASAHFLLLPRFEQLAGVIGEPQPDWLTGDGTNRPREAQREAGGAVARDLPLDQIVAHPVPNAEPTSLG